MGEYLALRWCKIAPKGPKYLCVVYRELEERGFIEKNFNQQMSFYAEEDTITLFKSN